MSAPRTAGVTLVMPMYNEASDIAEVLASVAAQTYPHHALRLLVIDGMSTDGCAETAAAWFASSGIAGEVISNPRRRIPTSLNVGLAHARSGDYVVRLDAHTIYDSDYVATIVRAFERAPARVACVGGGVFPAPTGRFDHALVGALHTNPMGLGGAVRRKGNAKTRAVRGVYLGAWRPGVVESVGGFNEDWDANEDSELAARLRCGGYQTWAIPVRCAYRVKHGPLAALKQWAGYGFWRAQTLRLHPREVRLRHLIPPLALLAAAVLAATPLRAFVVLLYTAYAFCVFAMRAPGERLDVTIASCVFFPAAQVAWTFGLLRGLTTPARTAAVQ